MLIHSRFSFNFFGDDKGRVAVLQAGVRWRHVHFELEHRLEQRVVEAREEVLRLVRWQTSGEEVSGNRKQTFDLSSIILLTNS